MNWQEKPQVKMGKLGETLVRNYLINMGFVPFSPDENAGAHPFDFLCASKDKKRIFVAEVKTKPARKYYPDTGFNVSSYNTYLEVSRNYNMDVFCFFVDTAKREVDGNYLSVLATDTEVKHGNKTLVYPITDKGIVYFPIQSMITIATLTIDQCSEIESHATRRY